jgi:GntR family transcriptional repressor for pyruvate dehydrogenase complex
LTEESIPTTAPLKVRVATQINLHIEERQLAGGARLPAERQFAASLNVSRSSLREAIKLLEAQGRLVVRHGQGVFVSSTTEEMMRERTRQQRMSSQELFAMRVVLEEPAARWAATRAQAADLDDLRKILDELDGTTTQPIDVELITKLDSKFHMHVVKMAGNRFLQQTLGVLQEMLATGMETTLTIPGRIEMARIEHFRILAALQAGDEDGAAAAAKWHILSAHKANVKRFEADVEDRAERLEKMEADGGADT